MESHACLCACKCGFMFRPLLLSRHPLSRKHSIRLLFFVHLILGHSKFTCLALTPLPSDVRRKERLWLLMSLKEEGRKLGLSFLRGRNGKAPAEQEGRGGEAEWDWGEGCTLESRIWSLRFSSRDQKSDYSTSSDRLSSGICICPWFCPHLLPRSFQTVTHMGLNEGPYFLVWREVSFAYVWFFFFFLVVSSTSTVSLP